MTASDIAVLDFTATSLGRFAEIEPRTVNWPVVYVIDDEEAGRAYVGETLNTSGRMRQHLRTRGALLRRVRLIIDETFNKSVCLDLESQLIAWLNADQKYQLLNSNAGIVGAQYYDRISYQETFKKIFAQLREDGLFEQSLEDLENSEIFKLSPFKALNADQTRVVLRVVEDLFHDVENSVSETVIVRGEPGTGKTVLGVYLIKLLRDIIDGTDFDGERESLFATFLSNEYQTILGMGFRIGLVVPQQALRRSLQRVFESTPGLAPEMVLSPFDVGKADVGWDLLVVDEAHRLGRRSNQSSGVQNRAFSEINQKLLGDDDQRHTQLDWIVAQSTHRVLLLDPEQSVRPADLSARIQRSLVRDARDTDRFHPLTTQMRVAAGSDYVGFVRSVLRGERPSPPDLGDYDLRLFDDLGGMHAAIKRMDRRFGLARLVAGFAWEWKSKKDRGAVDIALDGIELQWNRTDKDWITSPGAVDQVGSIHTVQGYDLNYAGVIIGPDLKLDPDSRQIVFSRADYHDKKGKQNLPKLGVVLTDDDILRYVTNVYSVLLTRGIRGTYVYVVDPLLREHLARTLPFRSDA
ncbi:DUF2075 domain-containing protein [Curtobacterium flaccumfaciens pv. flaccumfaciens]|jgi:DUF2075 family protein/predicted GIY-YIG superfamily endonuclease|uniref:DUF2075 domain-containing protein n=1 Tax=Curtobacterium flaccumfaciens TaxID=2035 RepID=UPI00217DF458|nr:DUF2075 domain-containing protein [Curtobacterium flaccumfaciens]MCS6567422.1 DUF2075 domain-containing protein [Curtobacterium flaccumfaciens pv. flaccumfaciens]MCS6585505.1 DUF2075 domain-containing protein [Curtobacterium flaccumfaciens pv. flaccumfaciens]